MEERLQAIEQEHQAIEREHAKLEREHAELKKTIELQTIAIGALVNKATLERLNEKYDKIFDALMAHDQITNMRLNELSTQQIELDGKIVGQQTEMRQRFSEQDGKITGLQTEMRQRFSEQDQRFTNIETALAQILARLPEKP